MQDKDRTDSWDFGPVGFIAKWKDFHGGEAMATTADRQ